MIINVVIISVLKYTQIFQALSIGLRLKIFRSLKYFSIHAIVVIYDPKYTYIV